MSRTALDREPSPLLKREGAEIVKVELPGPAAAFRRLRSIVLATEAAAYHKRWLIERPQDYGPQVLMRLQNGLAIPGVALSRGAALARPGAWPRMIAATSDVDAVLAPVAPDRDADDRRERCRQRARTPKRVIQRLTRVYPADQLSRPAVALDSLRLQLASGLPVGMQLVGRSFDEATLLTIGAAFQRATDFHEKVPPAA